MSDVERWLEPRLAGVPEALRERILRAVKRETGNVKDVKRETGKVKRGEDGQTFHVSRFTFHDVLRGAGERLLAEATAMPPSHDSAVTLLAADALMTFACEAMAETNPEALGNVSGER